MIAQDKTPRILIFRGGALGDFMLTIPAIAALRRHWPKAYLELVGYERSACLALATGLINRLQSLDSARLALYFQKEYALPEDERKHIRSFDLIVSYLHDPDSILLKHLEEAGAKKVIAVSPVIKSGHAAEHFYNPIRDIAMLDSAQTPCPHFIKCGHGPRLPREQFLLKWPRSLKEEARRRLFEYLGGKQAIIIHPGSGSPAKNWPAEKFALLAKKIKAEAKFEPFIIGGEADEKAMSVIRLLLPDFHIFENKPLLETVSIISAASGFVGNDSGITHVAAALGIPVVALFGPADPAIWAPRGKNVSVIKSRFRSTESLAEIRVEKVLQTLYKAVF